MEDTLLQAVLWEDTFSPGGPCGREGVLDQRTWYRWANKKRSIADIRANSLGEKCQPQPGALVAEVTSANTHPPAEAAG